MFTGLPNYGESGSTPPSRKAIRTVALILLTLVVGMGALTGFSVWYTARPEFCLTCHYMKPYYESWKKSEHNMVPCGQCHYPPDIEGELITHFQNMAQFAKYITGTYGTRAWAEISDASCLRSGCHDKRLLKGKVAFKSIVFDHTSHLTEMRRSKKLRCISCHSQIVQGEHVIVTESSCILCHFKDSKNPRMTNCNLCHDITKIASLPPREGQPHFDHRLVKERGIDCQKCHNNVITGDGSVPRSRCHNCHGEAERVERYQETEFMHQIHMTKHNIECMRCHVEMLHRVKTVETTFQAECLSCHTVPHKAQLDLYGGKGGAGLKPRPDPMYQVKVGCQGCHLAHKKLGRFQETQPAGEAGCISCHGEQYADMMDRWRGLQHQLQGLQEALERGRQELGSIAGSHPQRRRAETALARARQNIELVAFGKAVHNPGYSINLMVTASRQLGEALKAIDSSYSPPVLEDLQHLEKTGCLPCHTTLPDRPALGLNFQHGRHLKGGLSCEVCHVLPSGRPARGNHGQLTMDRNACMSCHHQQGQASCRPCHSRPPDRQGQGKVG